MIARWDKRPVVGVVAVVAALVGAWGWLSNQPTTGNDCNQPLRHVYHPQRLHVIATCQHIIFTVVAYRKEHDGDIHVDGNVTEPGWTDPANVRGQHGLTVVEFVPGDPRPAKLYAGQRLALTVTKVYDQQHKRKVEANGWIEGHPVFAAQDITPAPIKPKLNHPDLVTEEDR